ncbi:putative cyanobacterial aminoacyl-tRNA synthetase, CAAD domain, protein CURVATURE THYLAKOID 1 [Medicago truncatula]|uniref:Putative cyanobacterial aminoacyl-tRNA synthetase, CAAD domain, protein CURVATURE THYLAKOID 1 n=1 Tax=Medicago truncatula TaxID=3880 RepID=A0A396HW89_MEDTR|nr:putative cyanobacterial aminoacyl-tRNA synthetase, CAAD domain, protein CURVATURE THYLAKOID 1 [Medicago truncatula]
MGHCTVQPLTLSKLPNSFAFHHKPSFPPKHALLSRSAFLRNVRATASEENPSGAGKLFNEKRDGVITLEADKNGYNETVENEDPKEVLPDGEGLPLELLDKLNVKFDINDTTSLAVYGGGAIVALWLTSAIVGAVDSIPVIPKLFEVVGLGYSLWFTYRYLLFKRNREELANKIEELKEQVLGQ